jgi:hypothetical protein
MKLSRDLQIIYSLAILEAILLIVGPGAKYMDEIDTLSYMDAWECFSNGTIDLLRTPVYPAIIGILKELCGIPTCYWITIFIQHLVFLFSIGIFYSTISNFVKSERISFWITLFYATFPAYTFNNNWILTQSFALSGCVLLIYCIIRLRKAPTIANGTLFTSLLLFLLFLRPGYLYLLPVLAVSWFLCFLKKERKAAAIGIAGVLITTSCALCYMKAFEKQYGLFAFSGIGVRNQFFIAQDAGFLDTSSKLVKGYNDTYDEVYPRHHNWAEVDRFFYAKYSLAEVNDTVTKAFHQDPVRWAVFCYDRLCKTALEPLTELFQIRYKGQLIHIIGPLVNSVYVFILLYTILLIQWIRIKKRIPWLSSFLYMSLISNIITTVVGAPNGAYLLPATPFYLLLLGQFLYHIKITPTKDIELR